MRLVLSGIAAALSLVAIGTSQAASSAGAVITSASSSGGHTTVEWALPSGWVSDLVVIASKPDVGTDGSFLTENFVDGGVPEEGQALFVSSTPLPPGTYYVRVLSHAADFLDIGWSDTAQFTAAPTQPVPPGGVNVTPNPTPTPTPTPPTPTPPALTTPTPTPPPTVRMRVKDATSLRPLTAVRKGEKLWVDTILSGPFDSQTAFTLRGKTCVQTERSQRCTSLDTLYDVVVTKKMVVGGKLIVFATLDGKVLAKRSLPIKPKPKRVIRASA